MWFCDGLCGILLNVFFFVAVVLAVHYVYLLWNSDYWKKRGVFSPNPKALLGNLPGQFTGKKSIMYEIDDLYKKYKNTNGIIGIFNFREPRLLVLDPDILKDIMIKYFKHFQGTEMSGTMDKTADPLFGSHPFVLTGEEWKTKRAEVSPAFTSSRINAIYPITKEVLGKMINYIRQEIAKPDFDGLDAKDLSARYTISIVSKTIYNVDPKSFEGQESEILKKSQAFLMPSKRFMMFALMNSIYPFLSRWVKLSFAVEGSTEFFVDLMKNAMEHREKSDVHPNDYLEHLMNLKKKKEISDLDVAGHGASFLVDGFDTSSSVIAFALMEIGLNKDIQDRLRKEINTAMPKEEDFTYDNVLNLEYLEQIWNETLRRHFVGTHLSRKCNEPVEIDLPKDKKLFFERDSIIVIPVASLHMDPDFYPDPENFDPDRFSPENGGAKAYMERGVFLPFGQGPRICPGNRFAYAQSKICLAALVKNFEISVNPKSPKEYIMHPRALILSNSGCFLNFKEIN